MKKFLPLLLLTAVFFLNSCSDDDKESSIAPQEIVGEWQLTDIYSKNGKVKISSNGISLEGSYEISGKNYNVKTTFNENPNTVTSVGSVTVVTTTNIAGQSQTQELPSDSGGLQSGTWSIENNILTLKSDVEDGKFIIETLNNTTLIIKQNLSDSVNNTLNVSGVNLSGNIYMKFNK